jgi:polysaccharide export outer membrane protein
LGLHEISDPVSPARCAGEPIREHAKLVDGARDAAMPDIVVMRPKSSVAAALSPPAARASAARHSLRIGAIGALALCVAGCGIVPSGGPEMTLATSQESGPLPYELIDLTPESVAPYVVGPRIDHPAFDRRRSHATAAILARGDVLRVVFYEARQGGTFAPAALGGTVFERVRVESNGMIHLPYVGAVRAAGRSLDTVRNDIRQSLANVSSESDVYVELANDRSNTVTISGLVKQPGTYSLLDGPLTIVDLVNRAGGMERSPLQVDVIVRRGGRATRLPLADVYFRGADRPLRRGDDVVLEPKLRAFGALGAVQKSGFHEFLTLQPTLLDALMQIGGLTDIQANRTGVFVFRFIGAPDVAPPPRPPAGAAPVAATAPPRHKIFRLDFAKPESIFIARLFRVEPGDVLYVANAPLYEYNKVIATILRTVAIFRTTGIAIQ